MSTQTASNETQLYLPLTVGESVLSLIPQVVQLHNVQIDESLYEDRQVYVSQQGALRADFVNKQTGLIDWVFTDAKTARGAMSGEQEYLGHPKSLNYPKIVQYQSNFLTAIRELEFLKGMVYGTPDDTGRIGNDNARRLMELLNHYSIGLGWSCNPNKKNTTAFFKLLYLGEMENMPDEYKINHNAQYGAIVELSTTSGPAVYSLLVG